MAIGYWTRFEVRLLMHLPAALSFQRASSLPVLAPWRPVWPTSRWQDQRSKVLGHWCTVEGLSLPCCGCALSIRCSHGDRLCLPTSPAPAFSNRSCTSRASGSRPAGRRMKAPDVRRGPSRLMEGRLGQLMEDAPYGEG